MKIPVDPSMNLILRAWNSLAANTLTLTVVMMLPNGKLQLLSRDLTPTTDRVLTSITMPVHDGEIISATVSSANAALERGQCFVQVELQKTHATAPISLQTIIQSYVTGAENVNYPSTALESSTSGRGYAAIDSTPDLTGSLWIGWTVPARALWKVKSIFTILSCDANAADRKPWAEIVADTKIILATAGAQSLQADESFYLTFADDIEKGKDYNFSERIPTILLSAGWTISLNIASKQAGDTLEDSAITFEEFILI